MRLAAVFQDGMVLQHGKKVPVWGWAAPGEQICISIAGQKVCGVAGDSGYFMLWLEPLEVCRDTDMVITGEGALLHIHHVAIGEVWLAGGQSNMEFYMRYDKDFRKGGDYSNKNIRFYDVPEIAYEGQDKDRDYSLFGFWRPCDMDNIQYYSAVAWAFADKIEDYLNIPIGIIGCNWGGTRAVCWMDETFAKQYAKPWLDDYEAGLKAIPDMDAYIKAYKSDSFNDRTHPFDNPLSDKLSYGVSPEEQARLLREVFPGDSAAAIVIGPCHEWRPCGLYHTMLEKVMPYGIRGFLWYQGEGDADHSDIYGQVLEGVIRCWRQGWKAELPFILTQLAPFDEMYDPSAAAYPALRKCQDEICDRMSGVYCTSIGDLGSRHDIHPKEKRPVGQRMALLALHYVYGMELLCECPKAMGCHLKDQTIWVDFRDGDGLYIRDDQRPPVELFGEEGQKIATGDYEISVQKDCLVIRLIKSYPIKRLEFACTPYHEVNVYNGAGLPVKPFSLDVSEKKIM